MDFAAIDFETANRSLGSICALGIVVVERGRVVEEYSRLVRPKELYFDPFNIRIHGITPDHVRNEPEFKDLWPEIWPLLAGRIVVAHNASFDISVLGEVLLQYEIPFPNLSHSCTCMISRRTWPYLLNHKLNTVAGHLGFAFKHHDALEDARACAHIAVRACELHNADTIPELAEKLAIRVGLMDKYSFKPAYAAFPRYPDYPDPRDISPETTDFDPAHPFFQASCVFTGTLKTISRKEAMQKVVNCGGRCSNTVNRNTRFLIVGEQDPRRVRNGVSSKFRKAEELIREGLGIEILTEDQFLKMADSRSPEAI